LVGGRQNQPSSQFPDFMAKGFVLILLSTFFSHYGKGTSKAQLQTRGPDSRSHNKTRRTASVTVSEEPVEVAV